jgi:hypothetical protein
MGQISQLLEVEESLVHDGKTYKLAPLTLEMQAQFEQWLEDRAWKSLERQRSGLSAQEYEVRAGKLQRDIAADLYGFFSECSHNALSQPFGKGNRQLMFLRLKANHPDADAALVWDIIEKNAVELLTKMQKMDHDPNSQAPQAGAKDSA